MTTNSILFMEAMALLNDKNIPAAQQCIEKIGIITAREAGNILTELLVEGSDPQQKLAATAMVVGLRHVFRTYMSDLRKQQQIARVLGLRPAPKQTQAPDERYNPAEDDDGNGWKKGGDDDIPY